MPAMGTGVKAQCKNCGCLAPADQFKLHYSLKMMVCSSCYTGKSPQKEQQKNMVVNKPEQSIKPVGWDKDDEYLEHAHKLRQREVVNHFTKIPGSDQVKCSCPHCKYSYRYDPYRKVPHSCPYCNSAVPKLKMYSLS